MIEQAERKGTCALSTNVGECCHRGRNERRPHEQQRRPAVYHGLIRAKAALWRGGEHGRCAAETRAGT